MPFRAWFDVNSESGWFIPLLIPFILWWIFMLNALQDTGLMGDVLDKSHASKIVSEYATTLKNWQGKPVVSVYSKRDGNKEARLVVRTMYSEEVFRDPIIQFIFPTLAVGLFSLWCCSIVIRLKTPPTDPWRQRVTDILMYTNIFAIIGYYGFDNLISMLEFLKK